MRFRVRGKRNKFGVRIDEIGRAERTVDGILFASKGEAERYNELVLLLRAGEISGLKLQPKFTIEVEGVKICEYRGDFEYREDGFPVIEDFKGKQTPEFKLKWKLVQALYPELIFKITTKRKRR